MSIIKRAGDLVYTFRFLTLLVTKFEDTEAYKLGIIDEKGYRRKDYSLSTVDAREKYANYYTPFHRLVFNIKKLMAKVPGGSSSLASYAAALYLIKEKYSISEKNIEKSIKKCGYDPVDFMMEQNHWFVLEDGRLSPGSYKLTHSKVVNSTLDEIAQPKDHIRVDTNCFPVGTMFGLNVYEVTHIKTNQKVYVTAAELRV